MVVATDRDADFHVAEQEIVNRVNRFAGSDFAAISGL
jgi:hypothetical protein